MDKEPNPLLNLHCESCGGFFEDDFTDEHRDLVTNGNGKIVELRFCPLRCVGPMKERIQLSWCDEIEIRTPWDEWRAEQLEMEISVLEEQLDELNEELDNIPEGDN